MIKLEAIAYHGKHDMIASRNAEKYIYETLNSKINDKFDEVESIGMNIRKEEQIALVVYVRKNTTDVRVDVIKNNLRKMIKNLSKRYNTKCHVIN